MNYQEFKDFVKENIKDYLPEKYQDADVQVCEFSKNNNLKLDGLTVTPPDQNVAPTIYLNSFYEQYQDGRAMEDIMNSLAGMREDINVDKNISVEQLLNYDEVKDSIIFRVVGVEANQERLQNLPHRIENDMALIYQILLQKEEDGIATTQISNDMMGLMGVNETMLHDAAMENTPRELPMTFRSMDTVMREILRKDFMGINIDEITEDDGLKEFLEALLEESMTEVEQEHIPMYVLSNEGGVGGAAALFYPKVQEQIAEQMDGDYFVLPSSVHETLIVPDNGELNYQELREMVNEVNETQVAPDEVLTGEVYSYDKESNQLMLASEKAERSQAVEKTDEKKTSIMDTLKAKKEEAMQNMSAPMGQMKTAEMEI
ncbi:MAG: DUF5688 family protein [Lachnospiraceae bacterium]|nr:DUF5688 family protein [Lachnospiraceae bacterium]